MMSYLPFLKIREIWFSKNLYGLMINFVRYFDKKNVYVTFYREIYMKM
jgi:hypothetical protein